MKKETFSNGVFSDYGYDNASRLTSLNHKKVSDGLLILGYSATYDAASRLTQAVESPTTATTTYAYDNSNRLTSEDRTGANPYLSDYTYNSLGLRATAFRSEDGVTSHDGTYIYDDAARLTQVVEEASGSPVNEDFTWYNDGSLKTYPGPGYDRLLDYDEESQLTSIKQDNGTTQTLVFEYAYGFDGGRRWRKDYAQNEWNWYPCGVACSAGELVILQSTVGGSSWSASMDYLEDARAGNGWRANGMNGRLRAVIDNNGQMDEEILRDDFRVARNDTTDLAVSIEGFFVRDDCREDDEGIVSDIDGRKGYPPIIGGKKRGAKAGPRPRVRAKTPWYNRPIKGTPKSLAGAGLWVEIGIQLTCYLYYQECASSLMPMCGGNYMKALCKCHDAVHEVLRESGWLENTVYNLACGASEAALFNACEDPCDESTL